MQEVFDSEKGRGEEEQNKALPLCSFGEGEVEGSFSGVLKKLRNIFLGWFRFMFKPTSKMAKERLKICEPCKFRKGAFCGECWCELDAKAEIKEEECPHGFW